MHNQENKMPETIEEHKTEELSIEQKLFDAQKEINDLKDQIMWLERSYE